MADNGAPPTFRQTVIDTEDAAGLARFYAELFGLEYRDGDEPVEGSDPEWVALRLPGGYPSLAFQRVPHLPRTEWPDGQPQQMHTDWTVADAADLERHTRKAVELGATVLRDESDDPEQPLYVFADPAGHPFCLFVLV